MLQQDNICGGRGGGGRERAGVRQDSIYRDVGILQQDIIRRERRGGGCYNTISARGKATTGYNLPVEEGGGGGGAATAGLHQARSCVAGLGGGGGFITIASTGRELQLDSI